MRIERQDPRDGNAVRACYEVMLAAHQADDPAVPPASLQAFAVFLDGGEDGEPGETWAAVGSDGRVAGYCRLSLPDLENLDAAFGSPVVHPAARRRGLGRELLWHAGERAAAHGRSRFGAETLSGGAGEAFARALGARLDLVEIRRIQYLREIDPAALAALRASAGKAGAGYSLLSWQGPVPAEHLAAVARLLNAFQDAPRGSNEEARWDAARVRERSDRLVRAGAMRGHNVAAACDATGELAAWTKVLVDPQQPRWGLQQITVVAREHRGHRLGLLVKTEMLALLASAEPQLEQIETGNAADNSHMIAINEQLGYRETGPHWLFYEMPVAKLR